MSTRNTCFSSVSKFENENWLLHGEKKNQTGGISILLCSQVPYTMWCRIMNRCAQGQKFVAQAVGLRFIFSFLSFLYVGLLSGPTNWLNGNVTLHFPSWFGVIFQEMTELFRVQTYLLLVLDLCSRAKSLCCHYSDFVCYESKWNLANVSSIKGDISIYLAKMS